MAQIGAAFNLLCPFESILSSLPLIPNYDPKVFIH